MTGFNVISAGRAGFARLREIGCPQGVKPPKGGRLASRFLPKVNSKK